MAQNPRVLHVIDHTGSGGAQVVVLNVLRYLHHSFAFGVAVLGAAGQYSELYADLGVPVYHLGQRTHRWSPASLPKLIKTIRNQEYELVHTHLLKSHILGGLAAERNSCRAILHDHSAIHPQSLKHRSYMSNSILRRCYLNAYRHSLRHFDRVIALTPEMRRLYLEYYSIEPKKTVMMPNGIDYQQFMYSVEKLANSAIRSELGLSANARVIIMVGRLEPEKDWWTFLGMAEQVLRKSVEPCAFLIVGSGSEEASLRAYVRDRGLQEIYFLGHRNDVPALLSQADVFVSTSSSEPFGLVVLEAMAAGCPVVATRSGGPQITVTDGSDGLLADVGDVATLEKHVSRLLHDENLRRSFAACGRRTIKDKFNLQVILKQMDGIYREVLHHA